MASTPPFVPRSLQKGGKPKPKPRPAYVPPAAGPSTLVTPVSDKPTQDEWTDDDIVLLYEMCLSDYALWSDSALYDAMKANDGYVSLRLLDNALATVKRPEDARVAKALRARSERLDIRMLISQPDRNNWFGRGDRYETGGYEVRRRDWPLSSVHALSISDWNARSVYVENLPQDARSLVGVARLARNLVGSSPALCIQNVSFPAHFQAKPGEVSRCKGFAFVVFDSPELASRFTSAWPWNNRDRATDTHAGVSDPNAAQRAALTSGLRCIPHERWIALKNEYLDYQASLVEAATRSTPAAAVPSSSSAPPTPMRAPLPVKRIEVHADESANFPRNRLVLMQGIPLGATKTSVRAMLSQALDNGEGIDYIDFVKNVDRCHVRLSSPDHARKLVAYFDGQGDDGTRAELVQGDQEAIYWDKVPEKLRKAAMGLTSAPEPVDSKRPRKRLKQTK